MTLLSSPRTWKWHWLGWEVLFPLALPIIMSAAFVLLWEVGPSPVHFSLAVVFDLTPWTLSFFAITLLAGALRRLQMQAAQSPTGAPQISLQPVFWLLIVQAFLSAVVFAFFVIWRHSPHYEPTPAAYSLSIAIVAAAIRTCHAVG